MQTMIVYVDDAEYARNFLSAPLSAGQTLSAQGERHWIIVACVPQMTNDVGKWVSAEAKELWREDWAKAAFDQIKPMLGAVGNTVSTQIASQKTSLIDQTHDLLQQHKGAEVIDARRPKFGQDMEPVVNSSQPNVNKKVAGLAAAVTIATVLAADF